MIDRGLKLISPDRLDQIETDWALIFEPAHVVMRYAEAVQSSLRAFLRCEHDAEEVAQDFFLWVTQHGLPRASQDRGRFRDYLKKVVRNQAINYLRNKRPYTREIGMVDVASADEVVSLSDQEWLEHWRDCLMTRAWQRLEEYQFHSPKGRYFTVLHLCVNHPDEDSEQLAARVRAIDGGILSAVAFRKQVSRARRVFCKLLVAEVAKTLDDPSPAEVDEELAELGLMAYIQDYLPIRRA